MPTTRRPRPTPKRKRLTTREGAVVTSLALPRGLHRQARLVALDLNWTFAEVVREALAEWFARHQSELVGGRGGRR